VPLQSRENVTVSIRLLNRSGDSTEQAMINPANGDILAFTLFRDRGHKIPLDTRSPIQIVEVLEGKKLLSLPLFGRIHAHQNISRGSYQANLDLLISY